MGGALASGSQWGLDNLIFSCSFSGVEALSSPSHMQLEGNSP